MIIEPRVRGFICTTAHPVGCATNVREQIAYVLRPGRHSGVPQARRRAGVFDGLRPCEPHRRDLRRRGRHHRRVAGARAFSEQDGQRRLVQQPRIRDRGREDRTVSRHARGRRLLRRVEENLHRPCARKVRTAGHAGLQHGRAGPDRSGHRQDLSLGDQAARRSRRHQDAQHRNRRGLRDDHCAGE